jgi:hypothetical protein
MQIAVYFWPSPLLGTDQYIKKARHIFLCFARISYGGAKGDRTPDLIAASDALSQLSYGPMLDDKNEFIIAKPALSMGFHGIVTESTKRRQNLAGGIPGWLLTIAFLKQSGP